MNAHVRKQVAGTWGPEGSQETSCFDCAHPPELTWLHVGELAQCRPRFFCAKFGKPYTAHRVGCHVCCPWALYKDIVIPCASISCKTPRGLPMRPGNVRVSTSVAFVVLFCVAELHQKMTTRAHGFCPINQFPRKVFLAEGIPKAPAPHVMRELVGAILAEKLKLVQRLGAVEGWVIAKLHEMRRYFEDACARLDDWIRDSGVRTHKEQSRQGCRQNMFCFPRTG